MAIRPLAIGQLVGTLTSLPGIDEVEFYVSGVLIDVPAPNGEVLTGAVSRTDFTDIMPSARPEASQAPTAPAAEQPATDDPASEEPAADEPVPDSDGGTDSET